MKKSCLARRALIKIWAWAGCASRMAKITVNIIRTISVWVVIIRVAVLEEAVSHTSISSWHKVLTRSAFYTIVLASSCAFFASRITTSTIVCSVCVHARLTDTLPSQRWSDNVQSLVSSASEAVCFQRTIASVAEFVARIAVGSILSLLANRETRSIISRTYFTLSLRTQSCARSCWSTNSSRKMNITITLI